APGGRVPPLPRTLNQPGGNVPGITLLGAAAVTKRLQLLHELMPQIATFAYLVNPNNPNRSIELRAAETAAHSLGMEMLVISAGSKSEIEVHSHHGSTSSGRSPRRL